MSVFCFWPILLFFLRYVTSDIYIFCNVVNNSGYIIRFTIYCLSFST